MVARSVTYYSKEFSWVDVGQRLAYRRQELKWGAAHVASAIRVSIDYYDAMEAGKLHVSAELILKLARTLACSTDYILGN